MMGDAHPSSALQPRVLAQMAVHSAQDETAEMVGLTAEQLGIEVPAIPGDVSLCGEIPKEAVAALAAQHRAWIYLNPPNDPAFFREEIEKGGAQCELCPFPAPAPLPSEEQVAAILEAFDKLPRPLMVQCKSGNRAGAALLLWLGRRRGYSMESLKQIAIDSDLKVWTRCTTCGPVREWLLEKMPVHDGMEVKHVGRTIFHQLFDAATGTFTYILGCADSMEAVLIDPVLEQKSRDLSVLDELGLELKYVVNTHAHADHVTSGGEIRKLKPEIRTVISKASGAKADIHVEHDDKVKFGGLELAALATPGHTAGCITWVLKGSPTMAFTGDTLLIRGCGRTDFQEGDAGVLYDNVHMHIFSLPGDTLVYPGHDYKGRNVSTVDEERRYNSRLTKSKDEFVKLMSELQLPYPKRIDWALPMNMACGVQD
eukprot:gnl/TRDRNA2_/TRDRNA2_175162_c0_seq1.p1 gnl/TRDRNA2_/TRDRNA2_175162_c0~~gnl/TRDRNA2_/TRDRNA2_175162_c0_seq1.p1  ORF type:complete len:427 (-),score=74.83 gnl/TRDRNA2_/TRDRNA2_175162_c0_seq1:233-1513(-)